MLELHEPSPHALERPCQLADFIAAQIGDRLVEHPVGDALRRAFEPTNTPGEDRRARETDDEDETQHEGAGQKQAAFYEVDVPERAVDRCRQEQNAPVVAYRSGGLDEPLAVPMRRSALRHEEQRRLLGVRVIGDVRGARSAARIRAYAQRLWGLRQRMEQDDARVRGRRRGFEEVRVIGVLLELGRECRGAPLEIVEPRVDQPALQRWRDGEIDDRQRADGDEQERERESRADTPKRVHASRNR